MRELKPRVLDYLRSRPGARISRRRLPRALGLGPGGKRALARALEELIREGLVERVGGRLVRAASPRGEIEGRLAVNPSGGFAFVIPEEGKGDDIYLDARDLGPALDGDRVRVALKPRAGRARGPGPRGRVVEVLERGRTRIVGQLFGSEQQSFLLPEDPRLHRDFGVEERAGASVGNVVLAEISHYPEPGVSPAVRVVQRLGRPDDPGIEIDKVIAARGLRVGFPPEALAEAERSAAAPPGPEGREDLTGVPFVTIDPEDARDFDDAVAIRDGRILVAIADVSAFVRPGSAIDAEAALRGCSVYFPDRVLPMLPEPLTADACSLRPGEERPALVADLPVPGTTGEPRFYPGRIRSAARLSYGEAQQLLDGRTDAEPFPGCGVLLRELHDAAQAINRERKARGALDLDLPESRIELDSEGRPIDVRRAERLGAHRLIEGLMIAANEAVAQHFEAHQAPTLFRVHERPDPAKLHSLGALARTRGLAPPRSDAPAALAAFLDTLHDRDDGLFLARVLLRSLARARYDGDNLGHHGLASEAYLHFTSPIRRYPDLVVHRRLKDLLAGHAADESGALAGLAQTCTAAEWEADEAGREVGDVYRCLVLAERVGESLQGRISGVLRSGLFVELDAPFAEVFVPVERLPGYWELDAEAHALCARRGARLTLGDRVTVEIEQVRLYRRRVEGRIVEPRLGGRGDDNSRRDRRRL